MVASLTATSQATFAKQRISPFPLASELFRGMEFHALVAAADSLAIVNDFHT